MISMPVKFIAKDSKDPAWPDLQDVIHLTEALQVAVLDGGTGSGRPSVALRMDLPDGQVVIQETTARLFCTTARIIMARYPDLFEGD